VPTPNRVNFARRPNADDTFDSIYTACFRTIARAYQEEHLALGECFHQCSVSPLNFEERSLRLQQLRDLAYRIPSPEPGAPCLASEIWVRTIPLPPQVN
jgi:hypothetical protein